MRAYTLVSDRSLVTYVEKRSQIVRLLLNMPDYTQASDPSLVLSVVAVSHRNSI
jgi:hypothetical protein